jgi:hypothetical protein
VEEPPGDEHEAAAKKKRPNVHDAASDFILLLWMLPLPDPTRLHPAFPSVP